MTMTARHVSVVVAFLAVLTGCSSDGTPDSAGTASPSSSATAPAAPSPTTPAAGEPSGSAEATPSASPTTPTETGGVDPDGPLEVPSPTESEDGLPGISEAPEPDRALVRTPLPAGADAQGRLVRGYPTSVLPAVPGSRIDASSVSPEGRRLQVTLTATTDRAPGQVLLFYRQQLRRFGLAEEKVPGMPGTRSTAFRRGQSTVTVTAQAAGDGSTYTLFSSLHAG